MAIQEMRVYHKERGYFGETECRESSIYQPYEERALKAVDKFFDRYAEHSSDVMHIVTTERDYVLSKELVDGEWRLCWYYWYGAQGSKTPALECKRGAVKRMVKAQYEEAR